MALGSSGLPCWQHPKSPHTQSSRVPALVPVPVPLDVRAPLLLLVPYFCLSVILTIG